MTTATKTPPHKMAHHGRERALHAVFGALETAGQRLAQFAKSADKKLTKPANKQAHTATP